MGVAAFIPPTFHLPTCSNTRVMQMLRSRTRMERPQAASTDVQIKTLLARSYLVRCVQVLTDLIHLLLSAAGHCHQSQQCLDHVSRRVTQEF